MVRVPVLQEIYEPVLFPEIAAVLEPSALPAFGLDLFASGWPSDLGSHVVFLEFAKHTVGALWS